MPRCADCLTIMIFHELVCFRVLALLFTGFTHSMCQAPYVARSAICCVCQWNQSNHSLSEFAKIVSSAQLLQCSAQSAQ